MDAACRKLFSATEKGMVWDEVNMRYETDEEEDTNEEDMLDEETKKGTEKGDNGEGKKNTSSKSQSPVKEHFNTVTSPKMAPMSYYEDLNFLDDQTAFDAVFGKNPEILPVKPASLPN